MWLPIFKAVAANILVAVSAFGFGAWISRLLPESFSRLTRSICIAIAGLGLFGVILFVVGLVSFTRVTIGAVVAVGIVSASISKIRPWPLQTSTNKLPALVVALVISITAIGGLAEPVGDWGIDGVAYHYVGPKVWLRNGIIRPVADNSQSNFPCTPEMVYAALMAIGGDRAPGFSAAWTLLLLLAIAASLGRRCGLSAVAAWWVAALIATMPALYEGSYAGFVDAIYASFIVAAIRIGLDARAKAHFVAFGILCGLAMATKYPGILAFPVLALGSAWPGKGREKRGAVANISVAAVAAAVIALPMYLRNWILLGSPIYPPPPSVAHFFPPKYFTPATLRDFYHVVLIRGKGHGRGIAHFFTLPYNLTYHTADFHGAGGIGLAPFALGPWGVIATWRDEFCRRLAALAFLLLAIWFLTDQESRFLMDFYAISAVFAVLGWNYVVALIPVREKWLCGTVVAISLCYGLFMIARSRVTDMRAVFSPSFAEERRVTQIPFVASFDYLNHDRCITRLLILDPSVPAYYSDKDYVKPIGQWEEQVYPDISTPADALSKVNELHVSHILDVQSEISDFRVPRDEAGLILIFERFGQRVYKVVPR
jgi:Dolichyl-phosphate-mannose-protein mannosyltransferase